MAYNKLLDYATVTGAEDGFNYVQYHTTKIVKWNDSEIILNSDGWETVTTKRKMNQAANQFDLGFQVYQQDFTWFVSQPNGIIFRFADKMTLQRHKTVDSQFLTLKD